MRKQAILIASRKEGEEEDESFENDVVFFKTFLKFPNGGCWFDSEITTLIDPTYKELLSVFEEEEVDYRFIYYTGHGCTSRFRKVFFAKKIVLIAVPAGRNCGDTLYFFLKENPTETQVC